MRKPLENRDETVVRLMMLQVIEQLT